jgi:hypothetical protein
MYKKIIITSLSVLTLQGVAVIPVLAQMEMEEGVMEETVMEHEEMGMMMNEDGSIGTMQMTGSNKFNNTFYHYMNGMGPLFYGQMAHIYVDFAAFLITMWLIVKIGSGSIRYPLFAIALAFLAAVLIPIIFGHGFMWFMALTKSIIAFIGVIWFIKIFGGWKMLSHE